MKRNFRLLFVLVFVFMMLISSGCSIPFIGGDDSKQEQADENDFASDNSSVTKKVKTLVSDYYKKLFTESIEKYNSTAVIPDNIKEYIADRTIKEGANNPEVGIHLPRYVEMNGMTIIGYSIINDGTNGGIETTYIGKSGDELLYYSKIHLMAKCLNSDDFYANYKQNPTTKLFEKLPNAIIDENKIDSFRVVANYDVEVIKEGSNYKILRATEASIRPGYQNRVLTINNDFMLRKPYINIEKTEDNKVYINKSDGTRYENDVKLIESFFKNFREIDKERMNLLKSKWIIGQKDFTDYLFGTLKLNQDKNKKVIIEIDDKYKTKFNIDDFPLRVSMKKIVKISNFNIAPHPAYTEKQNRYIVSFEVNAELLNGVIGQQTKYRYDYYVTLSGKDKEQKVTGIYLNSVNSIIEAQSNSNAVPTNDADKTN